VTELSNWLINAFNGEWLKIANAKPVAEARKRDLEELRERIGLIAS
jgi:dipeptidyl aminopeptidase B